MRCAGYLRLIAAGWRDGAEVEVVYIVNQPAARGDTRPHQRRVSPSVFLKKTSLVLTGDPLIPFLAGRQKINPRDAGVLHTTFFCHRDTESTEGLMSA